MTASTGRTRAALHLLAPLLVALVTVTGLLPSTASRWSADDAYVLEHLQSPEWRTRLFAFNLDHPSEHSGAWWDGIVYQRRFVRVLPSALMALEVRVLGQDPVRLHLISLLLHLFSTLLVFHLARRLYTVTADPRSRRQRQSPSRALRPGGRLPSACRPTTRPGRRPQAAGPTQWPAFPPGGTRVGSSQ